MALRLYKDMAELIGRTAEDLDWQRLGLENFFQDDSSEDEIYDLILGRRLSVLSLIDGGLF